MQWSLRLSESKVGMHFKGPIIGLFLGTCGCRKTTIIGGLLTALGWVISAYATNLFISFGLTAGIGSGMAYLPAIVMVGQYFKKRRALAQGLSTTGTGFGTFIMTLLLKYSTCAQSMAGGMPCLYMEL